MNVAYCIANRVEPVGGIPTVAYHEVCALSEAGHLRHLISADSTHFPVSREVSVVSNGSLRKDAMDAFAEDYLRMRKDYDVLHVWAAAAHKTAGRQHLKGKKVVTVFCDPILEKPLIEERANFKVPLYREGEHETWTKLYAALKYSDYLVCNSGFTANRMVDLGFDETKILINHHGADYPEEPLPYPENFAAGFMGTACLRKGTPYLIEAFDHSTAPLLIMQGNWHEELIGVSKFWKFNNIVLLPYGKKEDFFRQVSVYVQPSIVDGCPLPVGEAMAQGRPVIATKNCGSAELICDGWNGFIVPIRDPFAIAEKVQYFVDNPGEITRMGKNAREIAEKNTWEANHKRLVSWYESEISP